MKNRIILFISLLALIITFALTLPSDKGKVVVCDVGQGDAILAVYKNIQILVDTGPGNKKILQCLSRYVPFWDKQIEVVILTHGDSDHIGSLDDLLASYKVVNFFSNGMLNQDIEQKISSRKIGQNDVIKTNMFDFEVVNPEKNGENRDEENKKSIAGFLDYKGSGKWSIFLSGDIDRETEQRLVWQKILNRRVDVLKVTHHGSEDGTSDELLNFLKPKTAVISVGKSNRYGHPRKEVLERLIKRNIGVERTDENGEIIFELD